ncbi:MAG TPA: hypothetical protein VMS56_07905 [Thermoanaerobaculia bacterium]|nr:hypothetical protein [Thermoanaerobaculia bacterium]
MDIAFQVALVLAGLFVLDRLALGAERRGWIYYRRRKASPGTAAGAFLEAQSLVEPAKKHVAEARRNEEVDEEDLADPPSTGA